MASANTEVSLQDRRCQGLPISYEITQKSAYKTVGNTNECR